MKVACPAEVVTVSPPVVLTAVAAEVPVASVPIVPVSEALLFVERHDAGQMLPLSTAALPKFTAPEYAVPVSVPRVEGDRALRDVCRAEGQGAAVDGDRPGTEGVHISGL